MIQEIAAAVGRALTERRPRAKVETVIVAGDRKSVAEGYNTLTTGFRGIRPRFVVIMDETGYRHCLEGNGGYPYASVWLLVVIGNHQKFPHARVFVCPSGDVQFVEQTPLSEEIVSTLAEKLRLVGSMGGF